LSLWLLSPSSWLLISFFEALAETGLHKFHIDDYFIALICKH